MPTRLKIDTERNLRLSGPDKWMVIWFSMACCITSVDCGNGKNEEAAIPVFQTAIPGDIGADRIELIKGGFGQALIPVRIGNQTFNLLLDTGARELLVFADLVDDSNNEIVRTGELSTLSYGSARRAGKVAVAPVQIGQRRIEEMRIMLVETPGSGDDPSLAAKGADGLLGLRFMPGYAKQSGGELDVPLLRMQPRVFSIEFDLNPDGSYVLVIGGQPILNAAADDYLFTSFATTKLGKNRIEESYVDLQIPFQISSSMGSADTSDLNILLDTGATSGLVLNTDTAEALGYDSTEGKWRLPADEMLDLQLLGFAGRYLPVEPSFRVGDVRVRNLSGTTFDAVLGMEQWQRYIIGFTFTDFLYGGPEGTFRFLKRSEYDAAVLACPWPSDRFVPLDELNSSADDRSPNISADGKRIAFYSDRSGGVGLGDVYLYEIDKGLVDIRAANSEAMDDDPSLNEDGTLMVFTSNRSGNFDIYLYDIAQGKFIDLPGLNTDSVERNPYLSADGRYIAFRSERNRGATPSDIFLYDRGLGLLVDLPGLNTTLDEYVPVLSREARRICFDREHIAGDVSSADVHCYDRDTGIETGLSADLHSHQFDAWSAISPNGRWLAYVTEAGADVPSAKGRDIVVFDLEGKGSDGKTGSRVETPGLNSSSTEGDMTMNENGSLIVFDSERCGGIGGRDLYLYRLTAP